jgi:uncharacterized protein with FMN-binding domain
MQVLSFAVLVLATALLASVAQAHAASARKPVRAVAMKRDCTPINGRFGYYGNPWCDTGSYRIEDIQFRERQAKVRRLKGQREE